MELRNIAIIAHVDHGKTTMVDKLLQQAGTFREHQQVQERAMDSNDIERERGITILAKSTSVVWKDVRINIVDTPGHADFGGEVERILSMVDSCLLLVDAAEGPMPQTKFVLGKALKQGLRPIVVINKIDKPDQRADEVLNEIFDLFAALEAEDEQLDFPHVYASAKQGWAVAELDDPRESLAPLFDLILEHVPAPTADPDGPFRMLATTVEANPYLGRLLTGRVFSGRLKPNAPLKALTRNGELVEQGRVSKLLAFRGLERQPVEEVVAGDIVTIAGFGKATVSDTLCDVSVEEPLPAQPIDPSTIVMTFSVNDGPYAGQEGTKVTSRQIWDRLQREAEGNVAIRVKLADESDAFEVAGRGELQLAVLIETMRREGYELCVGRPRVLFRTDEESGQRLEPIEEVVIDVDEEYSGVVVEKLTQRRGELKDMRPAGAGKQRLVFNAPSRALIGYYGEFLTDTRGTGVLNRVFHAWEPYKGAIQQRHTGVLISAEQGESVAFALWNLEDRGPMFIGSGEKIYSGMIIGEHTRGNDLEVNPLKAKKLTNMRASGKDDAVALTPPIRMTLEKAISYIADDELVEVTPASIRLRKRYLDPHERKRAARQKDVA
ncbi:translational GTPase TypA [Marinimicrococcus flavescens]|uniref:Large ribosomal subunit assembly factor BipA n=1 Tax=Marinimicrococcus flavescens TaxID=3031815 RepID=A0AAP3UXG8_9PROT|nr:translational GTPase TypA [Marinimicrococcus flavescens]